MTAPALVPLDLSLIFRAELSDSYEMSKVLLATAGFDGTLQLLTAGWEPALGYPRRELAGKTLCQLMWSDRPKAAAAVAAILDTGKMTAVDLRMRCRDGRGRGFRLHRRYDRAEQLMYLVAEEMVQALAGIRTARVERRSRERRP